MIETGQLFEAYMLMLAYVQFMVPHNHILQSIVKIINAS